MYIDGRTLDRNGNVYNVNVTDDYVTNVNEFDCYDAATIAAWKRSEWKYVSVDVHRGGEVASIHGVEWGDLPGVASIDLDSLISGEYMAVTDVKSGASTTYTLIDSLIAEVDERYASEEE